MAIPPVVIGRLGMANGRRGEHAYRTCVRLFRTEHMFWSRQGVDIIV